MWALAGDPEHISPVSPLVGRVGAVHSNSNVTFISRTPYQPVLDSWIYLALHLITSALLESPWKIMKGGTKLRNKLIAASLGAP